MERIRISKNFYLDEFIDPYTYFNTWDNGLTLVDNRLFDIAQLLRNLYGRPIGINNWWAYYYENKDRLTIDDIIYNIETRNYLSVNKRSKKIYKWSGTRTDRTKIGSSRSAHRAFKAIDPKGNPKKYFNIVKDNAEAFYKLGLRRLEDISITSGWLHMDTLERNTKPDSIRVVDLTKCTETIYFKKTG